MKVRFDEEAFLDDLFKRAFKLAQLGKTGLVSIDNEYRVSVGIDITTYGSCNARMAALITDEPSSDQVKLERLEMLENHIGNIRYHSSILPDDVEFINKYKFLLVKCFECFGKRWYELGKDAELKMPPGASFKLVEREQFAWVCFDEARCVSVNVIMRKFFQTMLKCVNVDSACIKCVCITIPSHYHSYQRLLLKSCFHSIGIERLLLVNKPNSLVLPFLAKHLNDSTQKFIIDFSSGNLHVLVRVVKNRNL